MHVEMGCRGEIVGEKVSERKYGREDHSTSRNSTWFMMFMYISIVTPRTFPLLLLFSFSTSTSNYNHSPNYNNNSSNHIRYVTFCFVCQIRKLKAQEDYLTQNIRKRQLGKVLM
jgi:hypothetical protein